MMARWGILVVLVLGALGLAAPSPLGAQGASDLMNKAKQLTGPLDLNSASLDKILSPELFDKVKGFLTVK